MSYVDQVTNFQNVHLKPINPKNIWIFLLCLSIAFINQHISLQIARL